MIPRSLPAWKDFGRRALASRMLGDTAWVGSASIVNGLIGALASAIYSRTLGLAGFGTLTLILSLMTLLVALSDLGISGSLIRFGTPRVAAGDIPGFRSVVSIAAKGKLLLSGIILVVAAVLVMPVSTIYQHLDPSIATYFFWALLAVALSMAASFFPPIYQSFRRFRDSALLSIVPTTAKILALGVILVFALGLSVTVAVWIEIGIAFLLLIFSYSSSPEKHLVVPGTDKALRKDMLSFNKWLSLYYVINLLGGRLDIFFVGGLSDARALGLYGAASKVAAMVVVVTNSYLTVLLPELSASLSRENLAKKQRQAFAMVALFSAGIIVLAIIARPLIVIIFGQAFADASELLQILCGGLIFTVLTYPINATLFAMNKSAVFPLTSVLGVAALAIGNATLVPTMGAYGAAIAFTISGLVSFLAATIMYSFVTRQQRPAV